MSIRIPQLDPEGEEDDFDDCSGLFVPYLMEERAGVVTSWTGLPYNECDTQQTVLICD